MPDPAPLPTFDARNFEPPAWAADPLHADTKGAPEEEEAHDASESGSDGGSVYSLGVEEEDGVVRFTTAELKNLLAKGETAKKEGNSHFTAKPKRLDSARDSYLSALDCLPTPPPVPPTSRIVSLEEEEREEVFVAIRVCAKAVWGNLGAVYLAKGEHKECVDACTKALEIDNEYIKVLQRRAAANEAIGTWSSLTSAQEDYNRLLTLLPASQQPGVKRTVAALQPRIAEQQKKEQDEMLGKLKELGNGLLGKFGLSTDMFKFDEQPGGGYNMRFEK